MPAMPQSSTLTFAPMCPPGLKSQHLTAIAWLATATNAQVTGLSIGSSVLEFRPQQAPSASTHLSLRALERGPDQPPARLAIAAESAAASTLLVFQAILPFLLFADTGADDHAVPGLSAAIGVDISGGTNVSFAPSFEYVDQVLLPALEARFAGLTVERRLVCRGWSAGTPATRGRVEFAVRPLRVGAALQRRRRGHDDDNDNDDDDDDNLDVAAVDASVVVPADMHAALTRAIARDLDDMWPGVEVAFPVLEDSGSDARVYVLLVAKSEAGSRRWGRDVLTSVPARKAKDGGGGKTKCKSKGKTADGGDRGDRGKEAYAEEISRDVVRELFEEVALGGDGDVYLQDQLVIFQALAEGRTSFVRQTDQEREDDGEDGSPPRGGGGGSSDVPPSPRNRDKMLETAMGALSVQQLQQQQQGRMRKDKAREPFGNGSLHAKTARWVTAELLPKVAWYNKGKICDGAGFSVTKGMMGAAD